MKWRPKNTVIITVYNRIHMLEKALFSLEAQSVKPDELIISDDGSSEDVLGFLKQHRDHFPFPVRYVRQEDKGFRLARCRNNAARNASGDFLIFLDQDLVLTHHYLLAFFWHRRPKRFLVGYPVRLLSEQTELITREQIQHGNYHGLIKTEQIKKIRQQYWKENYYRLLYQIGLRSMGPKLRGGVVGFFKKDFIHVNGYDEKFEGWGNEDDNLGRRFYQAGISGKNPFFKELCLHLYHAPFHQNGQRKNKVYHEKMMQEIKNGDYVCQYGYENPFSEDLVTVVDVN